MPTRFWSLFFYSLQEVDRDGIELEVIVVDNGSSDGTQSLVRDKFAEFILLENDENNYARALNLGISRASGDYIVITNNDATVDSRWLWGFLEVLQLDEGIGAAQSKIFFQGGGEAQ